MKLLLLSLCLVVWNLCAAANKYSAEMNRQTDFKITEKPFRMNKINILWEKAQKRLGPEKLKNLYADLKIQDKEEINMKRMKADGEDKDGLKEAALRKRFKALMDRYDLGDQLQHLEETKSFQSTAFNEASDDIAKKTFADEKLNKLWKKAKTSGFNGEELQMLHEELSHHQEKLNEYHQLMDEISMHSDDHEFDNSLSQLEADNESPSKIEKMKKFKETSQLLKEKHKELKKSYDKITELAKGGPDGDFVEFRVQELWKLARKATFSPEELESLKEELQHYEHRIKKLKHLQTQDDFNAIDNEKISPDHKSEEKKHIEQRIKQYSHKVEKIHADLESRIMQRHLEL